MVMTQFAMVEELASLVKANLLSKHLVLSIEELLVDILQSDTSQNGILELQPMSPYHRLLLHRLADIYGFAHESIGEGDHRHLVLQRCSDSAIPPVLVSDILWQCDDRHVTGSHQLFRRDKTSDKTTKQASVPSSAKLEEREAAYRAARERIFSLYDDEPKETIAPKSRNVPVVARRMIAHALGRRIVPGSSFSNGKQYGHVEEVIEKDENNVNSIMNSGEKNIFDSIRDFNLNERNSCNIDPKRSATVKASNNHQEIHKRPEEDDQPSIRFLHTGSNDKVVPIRDRLGNQGLGAAKRIFANALGMHSLKERRHLPSKPIGNKQSQPPIEN